MQQAGSLLETEEGYGIKNLLIRQRKGFPLESGSSASLQVPPSNVQVTNYLLWYGTP